MSTEGPLIGCAEAHPNIALVKYWGKRDEKLNLPAVGSISVTLDALTTRTRVTFDPALRRDELRLGDGEAGAARVSVCLDLLREKAGVGWCALVESENDFPTGAGLASSASGFAALVRAADAALGLGLDERELSGIARRGSGSAARSIFGGYVEWPRGERPDGSDSVAHQLLPPGGWPLAVLVAITTRRSKPKGSSEGMKHTARTSPYWEAWVEGQEEDLAAARGAILRQDFEALAEVSERSCLKMHALMMASSPGLLYWNGATVEAIHAIRGLRHEGVPVFFTVDAGPQVKAICLPEASDEVERALRGVGGVLEVIRSGIGDGARVTHAMPVVGD